MAVAVRFQPPEINPGNVHTYLNLRLDNGNLVAKWITKKGLARVAIGTAIGSGLGAVIGLVVAVFTKNKKATGKIVGLGAGGGCAAGLCCSSAIVGVQFGYIQRSLKVLDETVKSVPRNDIVNACEALFHYLFDSHVETSRVKNIICPISHDVIAVPVRIQGDPTHMCYDYEYITGWFERHDTNPYTGERLRSREVRFCDSTFNAINGVVKGALAFLKDLSKLDTLDTSFVRNASADVTNLNIGPQTAEKIAQGRISSLEIYVLASYLKGSLEGYNTNITACYTATREALAARFGNGQMSTAELSREMERLESWKTAYSI